MLRVRDGMGAPVSLLRTEWCFNVETTEPLETGDKEVLGWLLRETFDPSGFSERSFLPSSSNVVEVGPRLNFTTAWSVNAVSVLRSCGVTRITRIERSRRYLLVFEDEGRVLTNGERSRFLSMVHDRMTETEYPEPLHSFEVTHRPEPVYTVPVRAEGRRALEKINRDLGLGFDAQDLDYYTRLFRDEVGRDPTNVECFDMGQSNSEHSRHWFFQGRLLVGGREVPESLLRIVKDTYQANPRNSVIAFRDNSSAIRGYRIATLLPESPGEVSRFVEADGLHHLIFTAETHNFPTGVAPFPGAETGTGGRIRDVQSTGTGGLVIAGTAAYCVGNLLIPGYEQPWEDRETAYPDNLASPLQIEVQASNGASDYGNKFGEPVIQGTTRAFGMRMPSGERREWLKPIMFTGGVGQMDSRHVEKGKAEPSMLVVKVGGPAYRIGMGGGAASSMIQGENVAELDFNAVQRGDAEMEQKMNRVIRSCIEMGERNPIVSIHDQGAGGNCNVVKELVHPAGGRIDVRKVIVGDHTLSVLEIWGAEYQENNALLLRPQDLGLFEGVCLREKVPFSVIGEITGNGRIVVTDGSEGICPVDLELEKVLGEMPKKIFHLDRTDVSLAPLNLPPDLLVRSALERVLRLLSVGSKRFLTSKVDRSVTGLVARQQCCGPVQLTVSDVAVVAQSHFGVTGAAISIGEQPIKGLLDPAAMARMTVAEAVTNIMWARVSDLEDIRCSANWMWAPKLPGEGARLYDAAVAMREIMLSLGIAVDGGKDSLSMAAMAPGPGGKDETVKGPGTLVVSAYVTCPDITMTVTPDLKRPGGSELLFIDMAPGKNRLGGSALSQVFGQLGDEVPDVESSDTLKRAFQLVQDLVASGKIRAGHDRSDGGLAVTLLEMAFAGNCGIEIDLPDYGPDGAVVPLLFAEELGAVIEVDTETAAEVVDLFRKAAVPCHPIGRPLKENRILFRRGKQIVLDEAMTRLRDIWEETSFRIEEYQTLPVLAREERLNIRERKGPEYHVPWSPEPTAESLMRADEKPKVAIVREEGSNGDREMTSAFFLAGFEPWDVTMTDLMNGRASLRDFRGVVFVGGFSYADVLDSAKGWAGVVRFNKKALSEFSAFVNRSDTFSLGVCNGCQLMALLGWVPFPELRDDEVQPRFIHNASGRFESRFSTVRILESPSIMLKGMAGSTLGVWVAHGEGQAYFPNSGLMEKILEAGLAPVRYVDDEGGLTEAYPFNPNGSPMGITALCSSDGRHLAMMPHPERAVLPWQWAWMPEDMRKRLRASPWLRMFQNARDWCGTGNS